MDIIRQRTIAYEYLCRLEEAKIWIETCIKEKLPQSTDLEESLRNGVYLAKLGNFIAPDILPKSKIYDADFKRYKTFQPETTDIYDKKNMPRLIYCVHALSSHLFKLGKAPLIRDVFGKAIFTDEELDSISKDLQKCEHPMPMFQKIGGILSKAKSKDNKDLYKVILHLNKLLDTNKSITSAICNPCLGLKHIQTNLISEYKKVFQAAKQEKIEAAHNRSINDSYITDEYDELLTPVELQGYITAINYKFTWQNLCCAAQNNDLNTLHKMLTEEWIYLKEYEYRNIDFYCDVIKHLTENNKDVSVESVTNWHKLFQNLIKEGNEMSLCHKKHKDAVCQVNKALDEGGPEDLYVALNNPYLELNVPVNKHAIPLLFEEMKLERYECNKSLNESEIASSVHYLLSIAVVSQAVERGDEEAVWNALNSNNLQIDGLRGHCRRRYLSALITALKVKIQECCACPLLTVEDIRDTIEMINAQDDHNEELVQIIANINRAVITEDVTYLMTQLKNPALNINIPLHTEESPLYMRFLKRSLSNKEGQNLWYDDIVNVIFEIDEESHQVKDLTEFLVQLNLAILNNDISGFYNALKSNFLQAENIDESYGDVYFQMLMKALKKRESFEQKIIKIQALWRGRRAREAFALLYHSEHPPFKIVKMFIPLLEFSTEDYDREIELQTLKSEVVQSIRKNQELSKQIDDMDLKIGLLVQNRIALQDVAALGLKLNDLVKHNSTTKLVFQKQSDTKGHILSVTTAVKGLKSLTKENKNLLDGYQHLFYELQTNPTYLSKLLFCIPQNKTNQFLQNVVLSLYNFGAYERDEYLLLKLFRFTLEEEISCKIVKPFDVITSTPIVLKMAVSLSRQLSGLNSLQSIIGPLVEKILNDKNLNIETGPVEIYKAWRNETEMKTGQISTLPHTVSQEEALTYTEVKQRLDKGLTQLKDIVKMFLDKITNSTHLFPFCITYMARVLHKALISKFPHTPEKDILKIVGNLVYYQYLNAAIVAPDAFHVINLPHGSALTTDQRKNLASVAKILHFSAAKKGFGEESSHLRCFNPFIVECHERMKEMFRKCCRGPTLEEYFCVDEYTEATLFDRPHIYITVQEIVDTHALLVEYQDVIAPDPRDRINELLDDLGEVPSIEQLASRDVGDSVEDSSRLEVCLALINKFQAAVDDMTDINKFFIKTKELCVAVIPFLTGAHLLEALCIGTTQEQQEQYAKCVKKRIYSGRAKSDEVMTLREHIAKLRRNLEVLEEEGYVTREDGYQALVTSIALDLCNKGKYRQAQKRALATLTTKQSLLEKTKYYEEKCQSYDQYIKSCLANLHAGKRSVHACLRKSGKDMQKLKSKLTVKYTGAKLMERGVLLEIDGLTANQFKNVQFEITPTNVNGIFTVKGKFMGVEMETVDIDIQDLLQKQYEGCTIMDIFGDLFDEGEWSNDKQFDDYVSRFYKLFHLPDHVKLHVVVGNHDIGFHHSIRRGSAERFARLLRSPSVQLLTIRDNHFVLVNSMALHGDSCNLCTEARQAINNISDILECSRNDDCRPTKKRIQYSRPILMQHFPLFRDSDAVCTESDAPPIPERFKRFRLKIDALSPEATDYLIKKIKPRAVFGGHTHHGCVVHHNMEKDQTFDFIEYSVPSFSWRNRPDPKYILVSNFNVRAL
ncbi:Ras GTPase-activating-like protein IQGAP2 [Eumeta japonica]|uniref:Ras GTPase-activating-like protein IQGAP2 n=1 Tax=Eumeta variegata TaxID=151549 RepID=A0A4C1ZYD9_EUMVA|nr:Ras GTPase-activating-like protein IQGAP2 [Eumeta japonica]